jgi:tRNA-2-methylthio-N6-dimethylallyladenosine synthase
MVGTVQRVLVDGFSKRAPSELSGRAGNNHTVNFEGSDELIHEFVDLRITAARSHSLRGELANAR